MLERICQSVCVYVYYDDTARIETDITLYNTQTKETEHVKTARNVSPFIAVSFATRYNLTRYTSRLDGMISFFRFRYD